jgi:hypothetical protein
MSSGPLEHHLPIPLFPLCRRKTSAIRDGQRGPSDALLHFLRLLRFLRNGLGINTSDWGRWLDQVKDAYAQSKSSSKLPSLCSTQPYTRALRLTPPYFYGEGLWRGQPVCRRSCKSSHHRLRTECARTAFSRSCARSVIRARRSQCGVPQLALRAYPDDRLEDRGGTRPRFVERGYPHKSYHHHPNHSRWIWQW